VTPTATRRESAHRTGRVRGPLNLKEIARPVRGLRKAVTHLAQKRQKGNPPALNLQTRAAPLQVKSLIPTSEHTRPDVGHYRVTSLIKTGAKKMSDESNDLYEKALIAATNATPDFAAATALLREAVGQGSAAATYALATWYLFGKEPFVSQDLAEAARLLKLAAKGGIPDAMFDLAVSYEKGKGLEQNKSKAFEYYLKAAIRGDAKAVFDVGRCLFWGIGVSEDRRLAQFWLDRAKELGTYELT
jgi:TPR repeat protein